MLEIPIPNSDPQKQDFGYEPVDPWSVVITPRSEWGALPPKEEIETYPLPAKNIGFGGAEDADDGINGCCYTREECMARVLALQKKHMDLGLPDIRYNFIIGDDGNIYEGRGWNKRPAIYWEENEDFKGLNKDILEIGMIGIQDTKFLHYSMFESFLKLVGQGVENKYIEKDNKMWDIYSVDEFEDFYDDE